MDTINLRVHQNSPDVTPTFRSFAETDKKCKRLRGIFGWHPCRDFHKWLGRSGIDGRIEDCNSGRGFGRTGIVFLFVEPITAGAFSDGVEKLTYQYVLSSHLILRRAVASIGYTLWNSFSSYLVQLLSDIVVFRAHSPSAPIIFFAVCNPSDKWPFPPERWQVRLIPNYTHRQTSSCQSSSNTHVLTFFVVIHHISKKMQGFVIWLISGKLLLPIISDLHVGQQQNLPSSMRDRPENSCLI